MIELLQKKAITPSLLNPCAKMEELILSMNKDLIHKDIERLTEYTKEFKSKYDKVNIKTLIEYLNKLVKYTDDNSNFEMCWTSKDDLPISYPLQLIHNKVYNINICNYIETVGNEKIIEIDLTDLADMLAFEFIARDLGETHESIEELLKDCGILGFESCKLLVNYFKSNGDHPFELSKTMKIEDSPYLSHENHKIHDYFNSKEFRPIYYRDVVTYSCRYANTIITSQLLKNCLHNGINAKLLTLDATNITILANYDSEVDIKQKILEDISVRVFGRRFIVEPTVSVF